jgi:hypothetical protein
VTATEIAAAAGVVIAVLRNNPIKIAHQGAIATFRLIMPSPYFSVVVRDQESWKLA